MAEIKSVKAGEILDSRGTPTLEVSLITEQGLFRASAPSGLSRGKYEAKELRDNGKRHGGKGVLKAAKNVNRIIAPKLKGKDPTKQKEIDDFLIKLDGSKNKSRLGANAILAVSMAACRAGAKAKNLPLFRHISNLPEDRPPPAKFPVPCFNVINGGAHAENGLDFQEFMAVPQSKSYSGNLRLGVKIYRELKNILKKKYPAWKVQIGDEGGFTPPLRLPEEALELILEAAEKTGAAVKIILDAAASQFFTGSKYKMKMGVFTAETLLNYYLNLAKKYPILGIEDPFAEDDWKAWRDLKCSALPKISPPEANKFKIENLKLKILIVGDDLLATNPERIKKAKRKNACNALIIKPNQIGTVSETLGVARLAKSYGWKIIVSHRSGETNDDFIADLAVGIGADFIKAGAPFPKERMAKYNRLLSIEKELQK